MPTSPSLSPFLARLSVLERLRGAHGLVVDRDREEARIGRRLVLRGGQFSTRLRRELAGVLDVELARITRA